VETILPRRNEQKVHLLNEVEPSTSICGIPSPIRAITEAEAADPNGRHFTCPMCLRVYRGLDRFGGDE
jgi:hypothetical protein